MVVMLPRSRGDSSASFLDDVIGCGRPVLLVVQVGSGPWHGLNGVQALMLTDRALYRIRAGRHSLRVGAVLDKFLLTDITDARWTARGSRGAGRVSFCVAGRRRSYASRWAETAELAQALRTLTDERPRPQPSLSTIRPPDGSRR
jgi:hypothetical protein